MLGGKKWLSKDFMHNILIVNITDCNLVDIIFKIFYFDFIKYFVGVRGLFGYP